ncbi:MAG: hypothetical protein ABW133_08085, partial [Polyangiaceae bacterium]
MKSWMHRSIRLAVFIASCGAATACGNPDPPPIVFETPKPRDIPQSTGSMHRTVKVPIHCPEKPPDPSRTRVMVVDAGFDLRHPVFDGKIAGCYQIECPDSPSFSFKLSESEEANAARLIEYLGKPAPSC